MTFRNSYVINNYADGLSKDGFQKLGGFMAKWHTVLRRRLEQKQLDSHGYNFCEICNKKVHPAHAVGARDHDTLTADHIVPKAKGGTNTITNLQIACFECNQKKADKFDVSDIRINSILSKLCELENSL